MDSSHSLIEFDRISNHLLELLSNLKYGKDTVTNYRRILFRIKSYMIQNGYESYTEDVGEKFLEYCLRNTTLSKSYTRALRNCVLRVNDMNRQVGYINRHTKPKDEPPHQWTVTLAAYLSFCKQNGNVESTIAIKRHFCICFMKYLYDLGLRSFATADAEIIIQACLRFTDKGGYAQVRKFLNYLVSTNEINADYSLIVPRYSRPLKLPSVYSPEEIKRLEDAVDCSTSFGTRNYAMILLASRMGIRSGDIVNMKLSNLDFEHDRLRFIQEKTGTEQEFPLIPEVKHALRKYIENARPPVDSKYIFLRTEAPYGTLTTGTIRSMLTNIFSAARVDYREKKHGAHSLRSSLASSLVNDQVPYEAVRKILGHTDPRAITHYAKIDMENLRLYSLEAPPPSGNFKKYLREGYHK